MVKTIVKCLSKLVVSALNFISSFHFWNIIFVIFMAHIMLGS